MLEAIGLGFHNANLLWGLLAVAVPLILHLWKKERRDIVDWGAMIFLEDEQGDAARHSIRVDNRLLLAVRMLLLALVAIALARPYRGAGDADSLSAAEEKPRPANRGRTFILVIDRSASMDDRRGGITPRQLALRWARRFLTSLNPDDSAAIVDAGARGKARTEPPTRDKDRLVRSLSELDSAGGGPSDLTSALDEAFRILADAPNTARDVIILSDGRRFPWRPDEPLRWELARELHRRVGPNTTKLWAISFEGEASDDRPPSLSLGKLNAGRSPAMANRPIVVSTLVTNRGDRPAGTRAQLFVDGRPHGPSIGAGPIGPKGQTPLSFRAAISSPGVHVLGIKLLDDDASPGDDEAEGLVETVERLPVLIVDGKPSPEPLGGQAEFLRIALDPGNANRDEADPTASSPFRARVIRVDRFEPGLLNDPEEAPRVLVLAGVKELNSTTAAAVDRFIADGGGVLFALGEEVTPAFISGREWFVGRLDSSISAEPARIDPASFSGPTMGRLSSVNSTGGSGSPLAQVEIFRHWKLSPDTRAAVSAKLTSGDAWCVERAFGKGRVLVVTSALDGRASTLPINPDFVPLAHEWILSLARGSSPAVSTSLQPGEPWIVRLDPPPSATTKTLPLRMPGGQTRPISVTRTSEGLSEVRVDDTDAPGVYRLGLDRPVFAVVDRDERESDTTMLSDDDRARLSAGWPLVFGAADAELMARIQAAPAPENRTGPNRVELWRFLILAAMVGLCLESWIARRIGSFEMNPRESRA